MKRVWIALGIIITLAAVAALVALYIFRGGRDIDPNSMGPIDIEATAIPLNPDDPLQDRVGPLTYRGGLLLTSPHPNFGGLSGMHISASGKDLLAVTDQGLWFHAKLSYQGNQLTGVQNGRLGQILDDEGKPLEGYWRDAEAVMLSKDGYIWLGFEHVHRLAAYDMPVDAGLVGLAYRRPKAEHTLMMPREFGLASNGSIESLTQLEDGRFITLAENTGYTDNILKAWIIDDGSFDALSYQRYDGFSPVAARTMPNGDLLVLERRFRPVDGVFSRLCIIPIAQVVPGNKMECERIAELAAPLHVDNFEALGIRQDAQGRTLVYLLSDDNFNRIQDTYLMMFELALPSQ